MIVEPEHIRYDTLEMREGRGSCRVAPEAISRERLKYIISTIFDADSDRGMSHYSAEDLHYFFDYSDNIIKNISFYVYLKNTDTGEKGSYHMSVYCDDSENSFPDLKLETAVEVDSIDEIIKQTVNNLQY